VRRLILFDVDGTLVDCGGQAKPVFAEALLAVFGTAGSVERYDFSGKTDPRIVFDLMTGAGVAPEEAWERMDEVRDRYLAGLDAVLAAERMRLLPGVRELLEALAAHREVTIGLLTGNWERGARIKLSRFDLNRYFPFGAFGARQIDRRDLPPVALARAAEHSARTFLPEATVIVGDARLAVVCARAHHIPVLAVATGWTSAAALAEAGADCVVTSLAEVDAAALLAGEIV